MSATEELDLFAGAEDAAPEQVEDQVGDVDDGSMTLEVDAEGNPITPEGDEPDDSPDGGAAAGKGAKPQTDDEGDVVKIKRSDWEQTQRDIAELRGYTTARRTAEPEPARSQPAPTQPPAQDFESQMDALSDKVVDDLLSGDRNAQKNAVKRILTVGAQAGFNNAKAIFGSMAPLQAQTIIDSYAARKQRQDPLYDEGVGDLFDKELSAYDTSVLVGQPREVVQKTLDTMYQKAKGDYADRLYAERKQRTAVRAKQGDTTPPNLGGGRSGASGQTKVMKIPAQWVKYMRDSGLGEDEIRETYAAMVKRGEA
ncbi:MAG: hypothetical protein KGL39_12940 [Patescibacteria group bacterium]|nr:hypothetical protein [Patescibacteria group bacterium]